MNIRGGFSGAGWAGNWGNVSSTASLRSVPVYQKKGKIIKGWEVLLGTLILITYQREKY